MTSAPDPDSVRASFPATTRFLSSARVLSVSLGANAGLTVDDLEDLRLGVSELVSVLIEAAPPDARLELEVASSDNTVTVSGRLDTAPDSAMVADELTRRILTSVSDRFELGPSSFVLAKSSSLRD